MRDLTSGRVLFQLASLSWSAEGSIWAGNQVRIALRKYPGDQPRPSLVAWVDCEREVAWVEGGDETQWALGQLEAELDRLLTGEPGL